MTARNVVHNLREALILEGLVRAPGTAGVGGRPWPPPAWKHPDEGAPGPGDAARAGQGANAQDDGTVVSILWAPAVPLELGAEERRKLGVDVVIRSVDVPTILELDARIRAVILGDPPAPGGRCDYVLPGGAEVDLYVIQSLEWTPLQPRNDSTDGTFTFGAGYTFEVRA